MTDCMVNVNEERVVIQMSYNIAEGQNEVLDDVSFGAFGESGLQADPPSFSLASLNLTGSAFQFSL